MFIVRFVIDAVIRFGFLNNVILADYEAVEVYDGVKVMFVAKYKRVKDGSVILLMLFDFY